jgi:small GTP-binding protein
MLLSSDVEYYKIILLGNQNVGKTSLIKRWISNKFDNDVEPTIGSSNTFAQVDDGESIIHVSLWDTAGQEQYRAIIPQYIRNTKCAIIVASACNTDSISSIDSWISELRSVVSEKVPMVLAISKTDLVDVNEISSLVEPYMDKFTEVFFVSSLTGDGVDELFNRAANHAKEFVATYIPRKESSVGVDIEIREQPKKEEVCVC